MTRQISIEFIIVLLLFLVLIYSLPFLLQSTNSTTQLNKTPIPIENNSIHSNISRQPRTRPAPVIAIPLPISNNISMGQNLTLEPGYNLTQMEIDIHNKINLERVSRNLQPLAWNGDLASVAREHSISLAKENIPLTAPDLFCARPFIHHEGFDFGLYEANRLYNRSIFYFSAAGENIFMSSTWSYLQTYSTPDLTTCPDDGLQIAKEYTGADASEKAKEDLTARLNYIKTAQRVNWTSVTWLSQDELEDSIVRGWMSSPGHRQNILDTNFDQAGIGVSKVNNFVIATQDFIHKVNCGYLDSPCCTDNGTYCYEPWKCSIDTCN